MSQGQGQSPPPPKKLAILLSDERRLSSAYKKSNATGKRTTATGERHMTLKFALYQPEPAGVGKIPQHHVSTPTGRPRKPPTGYRRKSGTCGGRQAAPTPPKICPVSGFTGEGYPGYRARLFCGTTGRFFKCHPSNTGYIYPLFLRNSGTVKAGKKALFQVGNLQKPEPTPPSTTG